MFIIKCSVCGRTQEWTTGILVTQAKIQVAGFSVFCGCGTVVTEEDGHVLREFRIPMNEEEI